MDPEAKEEISPPEAEPEHHDPSSLQSGHPPPLLSPADPEASTPSGGRLPGSITHPSGSSLSGQQKQQLQSSPANALKIDASPGTQPPIAVRQLKEAHDSDQHAFGSASAAPMDLEVTNDTVTGLQPETERRQQGAAQGPGPFPDPSLKSPAEITPEQHRPQQQAGLPGQQALEASRETPGQHNLQQQQQQHQAHQNLQREGPQATDAGPSEGSSQDVRLQLDHEQQQREGAAVDQQKGAQEQPVAMPQDGRHHAAGSAEKRPGSSGPKGRSEVMTRRIQQAQVGPFFSWLIGCISAWLLMRQASHCHPCHVSEHTSPLCPSSWDVPR